MSKTPSKADEYLTTASGNKVSRSCVLWGSGNIVIAGRTILHSGVVLRADLAKITIGRGCVLSPRCVVRPAYKRFRDGIAFFPVTIGNDVCIGEDSVVSAASIGSNVEIGAGCVIGRRVIIKDGCIIEPGSVVPPDTVLPPLVRVAGAPAVIVDQLPECSMAMLHDHAVQRYRSFVAGH